jgi:hypothetical protein
VTSSGGLAGIDVADNDDVDVSLVFLTHCGGCEVCFLGRIKKGGCSDTTARMRRGAERES